MDAGSADALRRRLAIAAVVLATAAGANLARPARASAAASPWQAHDVVSARLVAGAPAADGTLRLGLHFELAPGWHVYWKNPGDAGLPPVVELASDPPLEEVRLLFPAPSRYRLPGDLVALGYSEEVVYPLRARPGVRPPAVVRASVDYLACEDECIPFHDDLEVALPADAAGAPAAGAEDVEALLATWEARLPVPASSVAGAGATATLERTGDAGELSVALGGIEAANDLFVEPIAGLALGDPRQERTPAGLVFRLPVRAEVAGDWPERPQVAWTATGVRTARGGPLVAVEGTAAALAVTASGGPIAATPATRLPLPLVGGLFALTPGALAALALLALAPAGRPYAWTAPLAAGVAFAAAFLVAAALGRAARIALPLAEPLALAALALPPHVLAIALWSGAGDALRRAHPALLGGAAALLALPWASWLVPGGWSAGAVAIGAAGFAVPVAAVALVPWRQEAPPPALDGVLGFLAAGTLLWISHRLGAALLRHEVALVQLLWLAAALGIRMAVVGRGPARLAWAAVATAAALGSLWLTA